MIEQKYDWKITNYHYLIKITKSKSLVRLIKQVGLQAVWHVSQLESRLNFRNVLAIKNNFRYHLIDVQYQAQKKSLIRCQFFVRASIV